MTTRETYDWFNSLANDNRLWQRPDQCYPRLFVVDATDPDTSEFAFTLVAVYAVPDISEHSDPRDGLDMRLCTNPTQAEIIRSAKMLGIPVPEESTC
jgi:hypothetical protein